MWPERPKTGANSGCRLCMVCSVNKDKLGYRSDNAITNAELFLLTNDRFIFTFQAYTFCSPSQESVGRRVGWLCRHWWRCARGTSAAPLPTPAMRPPRIGLAVGGGAARGFAHVGVIGVLEQQGTSAATWWWAHRRAAWWPPCMPAAKTMSSLKKLPQAWMKPCWLTGACRLPTRAC